MSALPAGWTTLIVHPNQAFDFARPVTAREKWDMAWRNYRVARRENLAGYFPPAAVYNRFGQPLAIGHFAHYEGFRFITSP